MPRLSIICLIFHNSENQIFEDNRIRTNVSLDEVHDLHDLHDLHYIATSMPLTAVT